MPVRLDQIPAPAQRPALPRAWLWFGLLVLGLLLGTVLTLWLGDETLTREPGRFWLYALGIPLLAWCGLGVIRAFVFLSYEGYAVGWDERREEVWLREIRRGRRSQQVLGVSLYTALYDERARDAQAPQVEALRGGNSALQVQQAWQGKAPVRHSRLPAGDEKQPEKLLLQLLTQVLADLAQALAPLPADRPLALLLEMDSGLSDDQVVQAWEQAWAESGIRQPLTLTTGAGLAAVDQWLDQRIHDQALLMVVAFQLAPEQVEGSAEAAVGLLFGNRLTQTTLDPLAYLYRPEQERAASTEDLDYATRQALSWAQAEAGSIAGVWLAGIDHKRQADLSTVLHRLAMPVQPGRGHYNLDWSLGHAGPATPWLAIAKAIQANGRPQFVFSGEGSAKDGLWCTAIRPVAAKDLTQDLMPDSIADR
ncbi:hypothetical protein [Metapseudomonas boanensis]|uniref:Type VI secretion protein VasK n=1 Tax=Metapseudomonas boanensis TaxID=2822138 RepID=A0ABS5XHL6_9GAMM|nr:hypothetical protein [Pseudomonas boanensis]MBT8765827.1 hypothetical protein [Pseudomonas boanensis]